MVQDIQFVKVSIIIPVFNVERYIKKTLDSIVNQTFKNYEVIIINDGSSDGTVNIVENILSVANVDFKIINQGNKGVSAARNIGINMARGEYILFIDGDDYISEKYLEKMIYSIIENQVDCIMCGGSIVDEEGRVILPYEKSYNYFDYIISGEVALYQMLKKNIWIYIGNALYKKDLIDKYKLDFCEKNKYGEDQEFTLKFLAHSNKVACVQESLFFYVKRKNAATENVSMKRFNVVEVFYELIAYFDKLKLSNPSITQYIFNVRIPEERISIIFLILKNTRLRQVDFNKFNDFLIQDEFKRYLKTKNNSFKFSQSIKLYILNKYLFLLVVKIRNLIK